MVACLGHGRRDIVDAAARQAEQLSYVYYHAFTNERQERAGRPGDRDRGAGDGSRRDSSPGARRPTKWRCGSRAPTTPSAGDEPLADRLAGPVLPRLDPWDARADGPPQPAPSLRALSRRAPAHPAERRRHRRGGARGARPHPRGSRADSVAAFFCEPISAASLPGYSPPQAFWEGLAERRDRHGFLRRLRRGRHRLRTDGLLVRLPTRSRSCRTSSHSGRPSARATPRSRESSAPSTCTRPSLRLARVRARPHVGRRAAPMCGRARRARRRRERGLVERVSERGLRCGTSSRRAVGRARTSFARCAAEASFSASSSSTRATASRFLPDELNVATLVDEAVLDHGVLVTSTHSDARRLHRRPHPRRPRVQRSPTPSSPRWSSASRRRSADVEHRSRRALPDERACEYVLLAMPDMNGYAPRQGAGQEAFEAAVEEGTVMTDLLLGLDPVDTPIADLRELRYPHGRGRPASCRPEPDTLHELTWRPGWSVCLGDAVLARRKPLRARLARGPARALDGDRRARLRRSRRLRVRGPDLGRRRAAPLERDQLLDRRGGPLPRARHGARAGARGARRRALRHPHRGGPRAARAEPRRARTALAPRTTPRS